MRATMHIFHDSPSEEKLVFGRPPKLRLTSSQQHRMGFNIFSLMSTSLWMFI
ncbi:hypothetical protein Syun_020978 [Stephania yunnanensis]|uniref:Uncharacterized protein n=1 Tax=Stephania yunnanensis TaxID=152371 RepID=A0AAP0IG62_9MAGN